MKHQRVLHVVRHAKSAWDNEGIADIDRPLKAKGIMNAYEISRRLKLDNLIPDLIMSSPADRALHTAVIFARIFELPMDYLQINNLLYESSTEKIIELIRSTSNDLKSLMLFGHNPDFTDLANYFTKSQINEIPTSGVVTLKFNSGSWEEIDRNSLDDQVFNFPGKGE